MCPQMEWRSSRLPSWRAVRGDALHGARMWMAFGALTHSGSAR